ncbi:MAG: response regulator [Candidatus Omnitrophica bacterium]|nr:response regulator [Candidatus Omnitrophota bacterium]
MTRKILIVEDSPTVLAVLKDAFLAEGCDVVVAVNGDEAIAKAASEKPELVVLDTVLPDIDGLEVCRKIKENLKGTKIIIMTGVVDAVDATKARDAGADDYCVKTSDYEFLLQTARKFL